MDRIFFENVRCFRERQEARLAPVTVLVGENSSGKSTFLALVRLAWDLGSKLSSPDFNEEPFQLGAYDQIISDFGAQIKREIAFVIGLKIHFDLESHTEEVEVEGCFGSDQGQPVLEKWTLTAPEYQVRAVFGADRGQVTLVAMGPAGELRGGPRIPPSLRTLSTSLLLGGRAQDEVESSIDRPPGAAPTRWPEFKERARWLGLDRRLDALEASLGPRPYAFAPVRTKPKRTYDPVQPFESPEGSHMPIVLASILRRDQIEWSRLVSALESFGRQSGLFDRVEIRRLGELDSDPFQVRIQIGGNVRNLIDVGYGVSQVLPIIVDCLRGEGGKTYLLQQPEVHLHPSAQAELGSFLGILAKEQNKRFVIETHSDYLVDRIRMDIRDRKGIAPEDVSLLYFERRNGEAHIHELSLDDQGNILNPPPGYRTFFLEEERRFLGG